MTLVVRKSPQTIDLMTRLEGRSIPYSTEDGARTSAITFQVGSAAVVWTFQYSPEYGKGYTHSVTIGGKRSTIKAALDLLH